MTSYEIAFTAGERQSHFDRGTARVCQRPRRILSETEAAWWDGYCARNPEWVSRAAVPTLSTSEWAAAA